MLVPGNETVQTLGRQEAKPLNEGEYAPKPRASGMDLEKIFSGEPASAILWRSADDIVDLGTSSG